MSVISAKRPKTRPVQSGYNGSPEGSKLSVFLHTIPIDILSMSRNMRVVPLDNRDDERDPQGNRYGAKLGDDGARRLYLAVVRPIKNFNRR